jgi:hypothetical protein
MSNMQVLLRCQSGSGEQGVWLIAALTGHGHGGECCDGKQDGSIWSHGGFVSCIVKAAEKNKISPTSASGRPEERNE